MLLKKKFQHFLVSFITLTAEFTTADSLPNQVGLHSLQEMSAIQESHRLRLRALAKHQMEDDAFLTRLFQHARIQGLTKTEIDDFKQLTLFRIGNHDFKKGSFENSVNLERIKGIDIATLAGNNKEVAKKIITQVNDSGTFMEHDIHDFIASRDDNGNLLPEIQLKRRLDLVKISEAYEDALDLHDRFLASKGRSIEWGRTMISGSEWKQKLIDFETKNGTKTIDQMTPQEFEKYQKMIYHKKMCQFVEAEVSSHKYSKLTKDLDVKNYIRYRRSHVKMDFSEIVKEKKLDFDPPKIISRFLDPGENINQVNAERITNDILAFKEKDSISSTPFSIQNPTPVPTILGVSSGIWLTRSLQRPNSCKNILLKSVEFTQATDKMTMDIKPKTPSVSTR